MSTATEATATEAPLDFTRATKLTPQVLDRIVDAFEYKEWNTDQIMHGAAVRDVLIKAVEAIVLNVPPCPDRSAAIRKLREARMDCNSAITHNGKY